MTREATTVESVSSDWEGCSRLIEYGTQSFFTLAYCHSRGVVTCDEVAERLADAITACTRCLDNVVHQPLPMETSDRWGKLGCRLWNTVVEKACFAAAHATDGEDENLQARTACRRLAQCLAAELFLAGNMCYSRDVCTRHAYLAHHPATVVQCVLMCARTVTELCSFSSSDETLRSNSKSLGSISGTEWEKLLLAEARRLCQHGERIISEEGTTALRVVYSTGDEQNNHPLASLNSTATIGIVSRNQKLDDAIWEWKFSRLAYLHAVGDLDTILETMRILLCLLAMSPTVSNKSTLEAPRRTAEEESKLTGGGGSSTRHAVNAPPMSFATWTERKEFLLRFMFFLRAPDSSAPSSFTTETESMNPRSPAQNEMHQHRLLAQIRVLSLELQSQEWVPPPPSLSASGNAVVPNTGAPHNSTRQAHLIAITHQQIAWSLLRASEPQNALEHAKAAAAFFGEMDSNALALVLQCAIGTGNITYITEALEAYCTCQTVSLTSAAAACYEVFTDAPSSAREVACAAMRCVAERVVDASATDTRAEGVRSPSGRRTVVSNEDEEESLFFYYAQMLFLRGVHRPGDVEHLRRALKIPTLERYFPLITNSHGRQYFQWAVTLADLVAEGRSLGPQPVVVEDPAKPTTGRFSCKDSEEAGDCEPLEQSRVRKPVSIHGNTETLVSTLCAALFFADNFASREEKSAILCRLADVHCRRFGNNASYDADHLAKAEEYALQAVELTPACPFANSLLFRIHAVRNDASKAMKYLKQLKACEPRDLILPAMCTALADTLDTCSARDAVPSSLSQLQRTASQYILQYILFSTPPPAAHPRTTSLNHRPVDVTMNADMLRLLAVLHRDALRSPSNQKRATEESASIEMDASTAQLLTLQVKVADRLCAIIDTACPPAPEVNVVRESRKRSRSPENSCDVDDRNGKGLQQQFTHEDVYWWLTVLMEDGYTAADYGSHACAIHLFRAAAHVLKSRRITSAQSAGPTDFLDRWKEELAEIERFCGLALLSEELLAFSTGAIRCTSDDSCGGASTLVVQVQDISAESLQEDRKGRSERPDLALPNYVYSQRSDSVHLPSTSVTLSGLQQTLAWSWSLFFPSWGDASVPQVLQKNSSENATSPVEMEKEDKSLLIVAHAVVGLLSVAMDAREPIWLLENDAAQNENESAATGPHSSCSVLRCLISLTKKDAPFVVPLPATEESEASDNTSVTAMLVRMCQELEADDFDFIASTAEMIANETFPLIPSNPQHRPTLPASADATSIVDEENPLGAGFHEASESDALSAAASIQESMLLKVAAACWCLSAEKQMVSSTSSKNVARGKEDDREESDNKSDTRKTETERIDAESVLGRLYQAYTNTPIDEDRESVVCRVIKCTYALSQQSVTSSFPQTGDAQSAEGCNPEDRDQREGTGGAAEAAECGVAVNRPVDSVTISSSSNPWEQHSLVRLFLEFFATESWNRAVLFWNVENMERARSWFKKADALASHVGAASSLLTAIENLRASINDEQPVED